MIASFRERVQCISGWSLLGFSTICSVMAHSIPSVDAVLVTYHPNPDTLAKALRSLCPQVDHVHIVDNTPSGSADSAIAEALDSAGQSNTTVRKLGSNRGIAYAQNFGIKCARECGCEFVILSDQDTVFPSDCVKVLTGTIEHLEQQGVKVAAIGPSFVNLHSTDQRSYFFGFEQGWRSKVQQDSGYAEVSGVIASGMLIRLSALQEIGLMNEDLFIDWVDFEWCWRAIASGYKIIGCFDTVIEHQLGDDAVRIRRGYFSVRSPTRSYYIVRNGIFLAMRSKVLPAAAARTVGYMAITSSIFACLLPRPRLAQVTHVLRGIFHGLAGYLGPINRPVRVKWPSGW